MKAPLDAPVVVLAMPGALASSISIPLEMISAADQIRRAHLRQKRPSLQLLTASEDASLLRLSGGIQIQPASTLERIPRSALVFVPALWGNPHAVLRRQQHTVKWLQQQYQQGAILCSVGSGSYLLAASGLLDQKQATTHWRFFDDFQQHFPHVHLQRRRFITHEAGLYCTGSINAVRDVMLHFVEQLFDATIADEVARHFTHELRRSHESRLLALDQQDTHHDEQIIKVQRWLQENFQHDINMREVAQRFNINQRSFNRRFRQAAGKTPTSYLQELRMAQARALLKHSNLSIAETAYAVGYQDVSYFTGLFRRLNAVTPGEYRSLVRTKVFTT